MPADKVQLGVDPLVGRGLPSPAVQHVERTVGRKPPDAMHGPIAALIGHGIVGCAVDVQGGWALRVARLEPIALEIGAFIRRRLLLVQARPRTRVGLERLPVVVREPFRPQRLADRAPERVVTPVADRRQAEHVPHAPVPALDQTAFAGPFLGQDAPRRVVLMPARQDHHLRRPRHQARAEIVYVGVPRLLADRLAVRLLAPLNRVIEDAKPRTIACEPGEQPAGHILAAVIERPLVSRALPLL